MSLVEHLIESYSFNEDKNNKLLIGAHPQIQLVCYSGILSLSWKHSTPSPIAASQKLFHIPLGKVFLVRHLIISKETLTILKRAS